MSFYYPDQRRFDLVEPEEDFDPLLLDDTLDDPLERLPPEDPDLLETLLDRLLLPERVTFGVLEELLPDDFDPLTFGVLFDRMRLEEPELDILLEELLFLLELDRLETVCLVDFVLLEEPLLRESVILPSSVDLLSGVLLLRFRVEDRP